MGCLLWEAPYLCLFRLLLRCLPHCWLTCLPCPSSPSPPVHGKAQARTATCSATSTWARATACLTAVATAGAARTAASAGALRCLAPCSELGDAAPALSKKFRNPNSTPTPFNCLSHSHSPPLPPTPTPTPRRQQHVVQHQHAGRQAHPAAALQLRWALGWGREWTLHAACMRCVPARLPISPAPTRPLLLAMASAGPLLTFIGNWGRPEGEQQCRH